MILHRNALISYPRGFSVLITGKIILVILHAWKNTHAHVRVRFGFEKNTTDFHIANDETYDSGCDECEDIMENNELLILMIYKGVLRYDDDDNKTLCDRQRTCEILLEEKRIFLFSFIQKTFFDNTLYAVAATMARLSLKR